MLNNGYYSKPINKRVNRRRTCACLILLLCVSMVLSGCSHYSSAIGMHVPLEVDDLNRMLSDEAMVDDVCCTKIYGVYTVMEDRYWIYLTDTDLEEGGYGVVECAVVGGKYVLSSFGVLLYDWLADDYTDYKYQWLSPFITHFMNSNRVYCVFTNSSIDTVNVSGNTVPVEKYTFDLYGEEVDVGMWAVILPRTTDIVVE